MMEWFCYVTCFAKVFLLLFFFSLKHDIFITKKLFYNTSQVRYYHFFIVEINVKSVNLIQTSKLNKSYYHHDGEQLGFYKKVYIKTQSKEKDVLVIFILQYLIVENFVGENYSSPEKYFVTFLRRKFSPVSFESNHFLTFFIAFNIINKSIVTTVTSLVSFKSAQDIYIRCESPFDDRCRK